MKRIIFMTLSFVTLSLILGGCSTGKENFSTEPGEGYGWKSMQENHKMIKRESEDSTDAEQQKILPLTVTPQPYLVQAGPIETIQRSPEQYLRIWFAPYQDAFGNLHEEAAVQTVVQTGQWYVPNFALAENAA